MRVDVVTAWEFPVESTFGDPAEVLMKKAEGAELLVIGSRGYGRIFGALLGSVSQYVAARARARSSSSVPPPPEPAGISVWTLTAMCREPSDSIMSIARREKWECDGRELVSGGDG
jgi:hypothetical protein